MTSSISTYATEAEAIAVTREDAVQESKFNESGYAYAKLLTDDGDTITVKAEDGKIVSEKRTAGWSKSGHVNISKAIEAMVY